MKDFAIGVAAVVVGALIYDSLIAMGLTPSEVMAKNPAAPAGGDAA